jgi:hypothetical protein
VAALMLVAGVELGVLALDSPSRRVLEIGTSTASLASGVAALAAMAGFPEGGSRQDSHVAVLEASALGPAGLRVAHAMGALLLGLLAAVPCYVTMIVLYHLSRPATSIHLYSALHWVLGLVAATALLVAWMAALGRWLGRSGALLAVVALWFAGGTFVPGAVSALVPRVGSAAADAEALAGAGGNALAALGLFLVTLAAVAAPDRAAARLVGTIRDES